MTDHTSTNTPSPVTKTQSRRTFLGNVAKAGAATMAAPLIVPRRVLGGTGYQAPSDTLNIAGVGVGGMGKSNIDALAETENIVALCDVDWEYAARTFEAYPDARQFKDYRRMLDEMDGQIDGVVVATPDHTHAVVTIDAMQRGMGVYTQKPMTWSVYEARLLTRAAEQMDVATQMGNQGMSMDSARLINEYIEAGVIGTVEEVHVWTNRPIWPQGIDRPEMLYRLPEELDWDLFLGPAPEEPFAPAYHPWNWRGWVDYGTGALGDMGAHLLAHPVWALRLGPPETIETRSSAYNEHSWPLAAMTYYHFPAREGMPAVDLTWYDGGFMPPRPDELPEGEELNPGGGVLYVGSEGKLIHETYGANPRLLPDALSQSTEQPEETYERVEGEVHEMNWARAIRGEAEPTSPFSMAGPLTETMLLGIVSLRAGNRKLRWDAQNMRVTNIEEANQYLRREPRDGWALPTIS